MRNSKELSYFQAFLFIFFSTFLISGTSFFVFIVLRHLKERNLKNPHYQIVSLVQKTQDLPLPSFYLAEMLDLSSDEPQNIYVLDINQMRKKLIKTSLFKKVSLKFFYPGNLEIEYTLRKPFAFLRNFENTLVDEKGNLFPYSPFFSPKCLPEIILKLDENEKLHWGSKIKESSFLLAKKILLLSEKSFYQKGISVHLLDVSRAFSESKAKEEVVMICEDQEGIKDFLRIDPENIEQNLANYLLLYDEKREKKTSYIFDLRIPHLAFIRHNVISTS